jgi:hypothetical protein
VTEPLLQGSAASARGVLAKERGGVVADEKGGRFEDVAHRDTTSAALADHDLMGGRLEGRINLVESVALAAAVWKFRPLRASRLRTGRS